MRTFCAVLLMVGLAGCAWGQTVKDVLRKHAHMVKGVQSCEKRNWPVADPYCHGYALGLAALYVQDHPEYFGPDALKPEQPAWTGIAANLPVVSTEGGIDDGHTKPLNCGQYEFEDYPSQWCADSMPSSCYKPRCAPIMHEITEKDWQELLARLKALEAK